MMIELFTITVLILSFHHGVVSFIIPVRHVQKRSMIHHSVIHDETLPKPSITKYNVNNSSSSRLAMTTMTQQLNTKEEDDNEKVQQQHTSCWSPQDLTKDSFGFLPIPEDDYVKKYQRNLDLWPVEFFVLAYRRVPIVNNNNNEKTNEKKITKKTTIETQILVRKSANGTSKWGLGTGVPVTRWMMLSPSSSSSSSSSSTQQQQQPPFGYEWSNPKLCIEAKEFPEFPKKSKLKSWMYQKIDICEDVFHGSKEEEKEEVYDYLKDPNLEDYATKIRNAVRVQLKLLQQQQQQQQHNKEGTKNDQNSCWESTRISVIQNILNKSNSIAAIQGTLRMSGLFTPSSFLWKKKELLPDPITIAKSMRIFTMFPQMPYPMPLPSATVKELQNEIMTRDETMMKTGRDPHKDQYGRIYTHKSTSNVSNTIHGIYFIIDVTNLPGIGDIDDNVPVAVDLFGTEPINREWKSPEDLKVLKRRSTSSSTEDGNSCNRSYAISTEDTKPTFISGFVVRQLVKDGVIKIHDQ